VEISRRSRQKFADLAAGYGTVRTIEEAYAVEGFELPPTFQVPDVGQRRAVCAAAERDIDPSDPETAERLLRVYLAGVVDWGRQTDFMSDAALNDAAEALVVALQHDGVPIDDEGKRLYASPPPGLPLDQFARLDEPLVLIKHLQRIQDGITRDPAAAIGSAKELVESTLKFVLDDYGVGYTRNATLTDLYKLTATELRLNREAVPESVKGSRASRQVLQSMTTAVQSLAELRNELGIGHGRTAPSPALARHARLAANAARTVVEFVLETWHERKAAEPSRSPTGAS
jgi:Abortive infection C-terminus